jgi:hypothetical protein
MLYGHLLGRHSPGGKEFAQLRDGGDGQHDGGAEFRREFR